MEMVPFHDLDRSVTYEALGRPHKQMIPFVDLRKQAELASSAQVPENLRTEEYFLRDFGLVKKLGDIIPDQHGYPPMRKRSQSCCDTWSLMAVSTALYPHFAHFPTWVKGGIPTKWYGWIFGTTTCRVEGPLHSSRRLRLLVYRQSESNHRSQS